MNEDTERYLRSALDILKQNSINRSDLNWSSIQQSMFDAATAAQTPSDTYPAIRMTLELLEDDHSFFETLEEKTEVESSASQNYSPPRGRSLESGIALIEVPPFRGSILSARDYAKVLQHEIERLDNAASVPGWIIDLTQNNGGNMWPMLAGLAPLLGGSQVGAFQYSGGLSKKWILSEDAAYCEGEPSTKCALETSSYRTKSKYPPVAVLMSPKTASSGEAVAIAFRGRPNSCSFGQLTCGATTANQDFRLSDGAVIWLTVATFADRNGTTFGAKIQPDSLIDSGKADLVKAAEHWIVDCKNSSK